MCGHLCHEIASATFEGKINLRNAACITLVVVDLCGSMFLLLMHYHLRDLSFDIHEFSAKACDSVRLATGEYWSFLILSFR
jgi:hypothetical protein